jgi:uncharacterized membrane protein YcaP (DUF421 family)
MEVYESIKHVLGLGLEAKELSFLQVALRGIIVFLVSLCIVRVGNKRFLSQMTAFDAILGFILASMLARAVNGSSPFFATLGGGFVLVGLHAIIAKLAFVSDRFGFFVKGEALTIVTDGVPDREKMAKAKVSEKDLMEEARLNGQVMAMKDIRLATVERNGEVSIIPKD